MIGALLWLARFPAELADPAGTPGTLRTLYASTKYIRYRLVKRWLAFFVVVLLEELFWGRLVKMHGAIVLAIFPLVGGLIDTAFTYVECKMRRYKMTDTTLRVREGLFFVREMTMTFANVQNVTLSRGPLQGIFGIADVVVQSAGGGGHSHQSLTLTKGGGDGAMHAAVLRGLVDAEEVRDFVIDLMRRARDTGIGDQGEEAASSRTPPRDIAGALADVVTESRAFREAAERLSRA